MAFESSTSRMKVTVVEVARLAGVSSATVSNVLNHPDVVKEQTRQRVFAAMRQLSYVPNEAARQLAAGRSRSIGLVVLDLNNPFFLEVARGVEDVARDTGYVVMLFNSADSRDREASSLAMLRSQRVSGALLSPVAARSETVSEMRAEGHKMVMLDRKAATTGECSVSVNDRLGGELAGRHLLDGGRRKLAFVRGAQHLRQHNDRERGLRAALRAAGRSEQSLIVVREAMSVAGGERAARELLKHHPDVDAVACSNDLMAAGVERGLLDAGIDIPGSIAIVGYDDVDLAQLLPVPLTSVRQPMYEIGRTATRLLIDEIEAGESEHQHKRISFDPTLVERASSAHDQQLMSI